MQLRDAADVLGVHYQTAYGWVRQGLLPARKVGRGYEVRAEDVDALAASRRQGREPAREVQVRDWAARANRLLAALLRGDETGARHDLDRLDGVTVIDLCERVLAPALRRVGELWETGQASIAHEHRASAICERLLAAPAQQPQGRPRGIAVVTTAAGERHALPALMAAACLREDHWLVHHLAADLPAAEVSRLAGEVHADMVVLSSASSASARRAEHAAAEISRAAAPGLTVLVGRPGDTLYQLREQARGTRLPA